MSSNGRIVVTEEALIVEGVAFEVAPDVDAGQLKLLFANNLSRRHNGVRITATNGGDITGNVFGTDRLARKKPWWRFW